MLRFDPFRGFDVAVESALPRATSTVSHLPFEAIRRDTDVVVRFDLPGVRSEDVDLSIDHQTLTLTVEREAGPGEGEQRIAGGLPSGTRTKAFTVADTLDLDQLEASLDNGVLTLRIPVAEADKPRRVEITSADAPALEAA